MVVSATSAMRGSWGSRPFTLVVMSLLLVVVVVVLLLVVVVGSAFACTLCNDSNESSVSAAARDSLTLPEFQVAADAVLPASLKTSASPSESQNMAARGVSFVLIKDRVQVVREAWRCCSCSGLVWQPREPSILRTAV